MNIKPKKARVYVPGYGPINRDDFRKEHLIACVNQVKAAQLDTEEYLRKHFEVISFERLPLFEEAQEPARVESTPDKPSKKQRPKANARKTAVPQQPVVPDEQPNQPLP